MSSARENPVASHLQLRTALHETWSPGIPASWDPTANGHTAPDSPATRSDLSKNTALSVCAVPPLPYESKGKDLLVCGRQAAPNLFPTAGAIWPGRVELNQKTDLGTDLSVSVRRE